MDRYVSWIGSSLVFLILLIPSQTSGQEGRKPNGDELTAKEKNTIRNEIFQNGLSTEFSGDPRPHRRAVLNAAIVEIYNNKPIPVLGLFVEIVQGGRAEDALAAIGYAWALEKSLMFGAIYAEFPAKLVDEIDDRGATMRDNWVAQMRVLIKNKSQTKDGKSTKAK